jgi:hypothetical protein
MACNGLIGEQSAVEEQGLVVRDIHGRPVRVETKTSGLALELHDSAVSVGWIVFERAEAVRVAQEILRLAG